MKSFYAGKSLFTWAGAKINRTIALMCKLRVHQDVDYNNLMIYGISPKHISDILSQEKPSNDELAALVSREDKEEQFDRCLSEERLNREFASTCLDVDKAWAKLQKLSTQFGSEDFYSDEDIERPRQKRQSYAWKGPKTDERINRMLAECIDLMKELGVPISDSICPEVRLNGSRSRYASCYDRGGRKAYTKYDYYIEMSGHILQNTERSLRSVLIHELLHTMPEGYDHRGEWKKWAKYVSEKTGYNIKRCEGDETEEDIARFEGTYVEHQ